MEIPDKSRKPAAGMPPVEKPHSGGRPTKTCTRRIKMRALLVSLLIAMAVVPLAGREATRTPVSAVSDWTRHYVVHPNSGDPAVMARIKTDPRWAQNWYLRIPRVPWPRPRRGGGGKGVQRDWNVPLFPATPTMGFGQLFDFSYTISTQQGYGSLYTVDNSENTADTFLGTLGSLTDTAGSYVGTYPMYPGGPGQTTSPMGSFYYDNLLSPLQNPPIDVDGLLFTGSGVEVNIWGNSTNNYSYYVSNSPGNYPTAITSNGSFTLNADPGGGQTYPAKFVFDVNAVPSCTNDFVVIGIPANAQSGSQANVVGYNNLYTNASGTGGCAGTAPSVIFAYASGAGEVPASVSISMNGTQIAYVENLLSGSSYFHVLTLGTTGSNGTSATGAVVPGTGNNALDERVLLSPDGGTTNQSSTTAPFINYSAGTAYVTTYSWSSADGYLYKLNSVFNGSSVPAIVWSVPIDAIPSAPVYDLVSNKVFLTDSQGRIDYVLDSGSSPSVVYGAQAAAGATSENPVTVDSTHQMIYATFNSNGTNALVVQAPTNLASYATVPVGTESAIYTGPYAVDFNNAFYTGSGTPVMYVAGTGSGTTPTLYSVGFTGGVMNSAPTASAALATGMADASPVTEFYNSSLGKDFLFVGVSNHCVATTGGGTGGCVLALDITSGFPTINAATTALGATGGTTGIVVDNNSSVSQASSIYYATKKGAPSSLVKATQSGLH
jgi:hypothetical protein